MNTIKKVFLASLSAFCFLAAVYPQQPAQPGSQPQQQPQSKARVQFSADVIKPVKIADSSVFSLVGNVAFHHNGAIIVCDSAIRYNDRMMECYKNVIISKDSTLIYGDKADYNGETNMAHVYSPIVKLVDKDVTMYAYDMADFNTLASVGRYVNSGTFSQKDNRMESRRAEYHSDTRTVYFEGEVAMKNDKYTIVTDSMGYDFNTEITTFYRKAKIWNDTGDFLSANRGSYHRLQDTYIFTDSSYVLTKEQQMWADSITYDKRGEISYLYNNIQILDEKQKLLSFGDHAIYWGVEDNAILTRNPSIVSFEDKEGADSVFMRADSIFINTILYKPVDSTLFELAEEEFVSGEDSLMIERSAGLEADSLFADTNAARLDSLEERHNIEAGIVENVEDSVASADEVEAREIIKDSIVTEVVVPEITAASPPVAEKTKRELRQERRQAKKDARTAAAYAVREGDAKRDSVMLTDSVTVVDSPVITGADSLSMEEPVNPVDSIQRVIRGFRNVKMFRNDFQAVCDSLVAFSVDSTLHMYISPVMWNESNQITAGVIHIYSKDEQLHKAEFEESPMMCEQVNDSLYNQISGRIMYAYFKNNDIYRLDVDGNAQTYYYMKESDAIDPGGFFVAESAMITFTFDTLGIEKITYKEQPIYELFPMEKIPADQERIMPGFSWEAERRPENRQAVFDRNIRPSQREESATFVKPAFLITDRIALDRDSYAKSGIWRERSEPIWISPEQFRKEYEPATRR